MRTNSYIIHGQESENNLFESIINQFLFPPCIMMKSKYIKIFAIIIEIPRFKNLKYNVIDTKEIVKLPTINKQAVTKISY